MAHQVFRSRESHRTYLWHLCWIFAAVVGSLAAFSTTRPLSYAGLTLALGAIGLMALPERASSGAVSIVSRLDENLAKAAERGRSTGALLLEIDDFDHVLDEKGYETSQQFQNVIFARLKAVLGRNDTLLRQHDGCFAVALSPERRMDMESAIQLGSDLQQAVAEPITIGSSHTHLTASIGICLARRLSEPTGTSVFQAARMSVHEALSQGPAAIRCYTPALTCRAAERADLERDIARAIKAGEIRAYFQPQISARTGAISGFEALARWQHPSRGLIPPGEFLPAAQAAGLMPEIGEKMMQDALDALLVWQRRGIAIDQIGVNFSTSELRDPGLVERIGVQIDKRGLSPDRLAVEVLETVVATRAEDAVVQNLAGLAKLGCRIDLDDFGTGHASITNIQRFSIERIKIDRSFVSNIDSDPGKHSMVGAILTMSERLGLETLAEGVETEEEREVLTKLGCGHIQGFAIARPMPLDETCGWISHYRCGQTLSVAPRGKAV